MKRCFVIMPFSTTIKKHTEAYWTNFFHKFIKPSVEKFGYSCRRSQAQPSNIIKDVITELLDADLVLAVLTDFNANVWYELGIRHALKRGTIMIIEEGQELPFDISQYGVIKYLDTISGATDFERELETFIRKIENSQSADSPVTEFFGSITEKDYHQRLQDLEASYDAKMGKIVKLLRDIQKDVAGGKKPKGKKIFVRRRVLWVDDYPSNNEAIIDLYRAEGVEFDLALNTAQALELLGKKEYDLIISDIGRGSEKDAGIRMLREIKRQFTTASPILIFSSVQAVRKFAQIAKKEGALFVTDSPLEAIQKMTEVLDI